MFTTTFAIETLERAVKSASQAVILVLGAGQIDALTVDWGTAGGFAAGAFVLSALTSVVSAGVGPKGSPSVVA